MEKRVEGFDMRDMRGEELKGYLKEQAEAHRDTERYSLTNQGYMKLMKYLRSKLPEKGIILDEGCNRGYESVAIQSKDRKVIGIDIGTDFIRHAKSIGVDALVMDIHNLEFKNRTFDAVYCNNTLEHAYDPEGALMEISRVLKKGGIAVICIPSDYRNKNYSADENWNPKLHLWKPSYEEFNRAMVDAGFSGIQVNEMDGEAHFGLKNDARKNYYMVAICQK